MPSRDAAAPLILFAPGAGAPSSSSWMRLWAKRLSSLGRVVPFDYPYQRDGRARPDRQEVLIAAHLDALARARRRHKGPVVLAGKSMGSRIGCHASLQADVAALVCFGYPLRSPAGKLRDEILLALRTPSLFVQGTRDPLCPLELLAPLRGRMETRSELHVVEGGDHSLQVRKGDLTARGQTQGEVDQAILEAVAAFLRAALRPQRTRRR